MTRARSTLAYAPKTAVPLAQRDHLIGPAKAPLTLLEYGDYECPYCKSAQPVVKRLIDSLGEDLCFAYRHFPPTPNHPNALLAAHAAEAAGRQGKFWEMHDLLFENQNDLGDGLVATLAEGLDLDLPKFRAAIASAETAARVREDRMSAVRAGVGGTPTFFVNGVRFDGAPRFDALIGALRGVKRA